MPEARLHRQAAAVMAVMAVTAVGSLLGCSALPPVAEPPPPVMPAQWSSDETAPETPPVWPADPALQKLQQAAVQASRDLQRALLQRRRAQEGAAEAGVRLQPTLGLSAGGSRPLQRGGTESVAVVDGATLPYTAPVGWTRSHAASVGVSWEADLWGRLEQAELARAAGLAVQQVDVEAARLLAWLRAAEHHWTLGLLERQLPLAEDAVLTQQALLRIAQARQREGKASEADIAALEQQLLAARQLLAELAAMRRSERRQLASLLDLPDEDSLQHTGGLPDQAPPAWILPPPAQALAGRPEIQRARLDVQAALANLRAGRAARYPTLSFSADLGSSATQWQQWLQQPVASLLASLTVPLVDWARLEQRDAQARSDLDLAALALRDAVAKALLEAQAQRAQGETLRLRGQAAEQALKDAEASERVAQARAREGAGAPADALRARLTRLRAQHDLLSQRHALWLNHAGLYKVLGLKPRSDGE